MITLYTKNDCPPCNATKRFLDKHSIAFEERNTDKNPDYWAEAIDTGFQQTPIVITDNDKWSGFNPTKLNQLRGTL